MLLDNLKTIFSWKSIIDISLVAVLFYQIIAMLKGTRAAQILIGMLVIFIAYVFSNILQFETLHWLISKFYSSFIIVVIVLFQDDIRRLLSRVGKGPFFSGIDLNSGSNIIEEITSAAKSLGHERIGALIVFERSIGLDKLYDHSVKLNAIVSEQLLTSIFQSFSPLHDGAVIIQKNKISCASAQLPLSKNPRFSKKLGTRHSAAVGISEETDAVVLVVSEETGNISIAWEGNLQKQANAEAARRMLYVLLMPKVEKPPYLLWFESNILLKIRRFKNAISITKRFLTPDDSLNNAYQNNLNHNLNQNVSARKETEHENKVASHLPKHIHIRFPRHAKVQNMKSTESEFVTTHNIKNAHITISKPPEEFTNLISNSILTENQEDLKSNETMVEKNEALKALVDLAPEDRFDPPMPKIIPPLNVSIGGVSLDKQSETEEHINQQEKEKSS